MSINLHAVVRGSITSLHPDEELTLYRSTGNQNVRGEACPTYAAPVTVKGQIQSERTDTLEPSRDANAVSRTRRCYLYGGEGTGYVPRTLTRAFATGGDMIQRADGTWWLVVGMLEDFSASGWVCVRIEAQLKFPANAVVEEAPEPETPDTGEDGNGQEGDDGGDTDDA